MTNDRFIAFLYNILNIGIAPMSDEQDAYEHAKKLVAIIDATKDFLEVGIMCECEELGDCMWCAKALRLGKMINEISND